MMYLFQCETVLIFHETIMQPLSTHPPAIICDQAHSTIKSLKPFGRNFYSASQTPTPLPYRAAEWLSKQLGGHLSGFAPQLDAAPNVQVRGE